jgi:hypothetical protein
MSWDVLIFVAPPGIIVDDLADDYIPPPLGDAATVLWRLSDGMPAVDLSDPAYGMLQGRGWSIELNIGRADPIDSIMLHVRGGGDDVLPVVLDIARSVGGRAMDVSEGFFLTGGAGDVLGWHAFQDMQEEIVAGYRR